MGGFLRRLEPEHYQGYAFVHWTMTMDQRATGWLDDLWHARFRELLTHTLARYAIVCPTYCVMPDHVHLLWLGVRASTDQRNAIKHLRRVSNQLLLRPRKLAWQKQGYEHVLNLDERDRGAFEEIAFYILANPLRARLVSEDTASAYAFADGLVPGYPDLWVWQEDYWEKFWKLYWLLRERDEE